MASAATIEVSAASVGDGEFGCVRDGERDRRTPRAPSEKS